jgi:DNA-binding transcriptional regulator of glucitol operon
MDTGFALMLMAALVLSVVFSLLQQRTYSRATKRLGTSFIGIKDHFLVSGRGKGYLRGAIVLLVIDASTTRIVAAEAMVGGTVMARFKPRPELIGDLDTAVLRTREKKMTEAVDYATKQYWVTYKHNVAAAARK